MNKTIFIAIFSLMMASSALLTSCSSDDTIEELSPDSSSLWIEPYCSMGSTMDQVKNYMASNMKDYYLKHTSKYADLFQVK